MPPGPLSPASAPSEGEGSRALDLAMARYAEGDAAAFDQVFSLLSPRLQRFLLRLTGSRELAADLTQETLLRLHQARGHFKPGMPALPWAYTVARNCCLDALRSAKRRPEVLGEPPGLERPAGADADGEQQLVARQSAAAVERALREMTPARREAFVLLRYEGLSVAEAAEVLGASEGAVKLRAFQAYKTIREALDRLEKR